MLMEQPQSSIKQRKKLNTKKRRLKPQNIRLQNTKPQNIKKRRLKPQNIKLQNTKHPNMKHPNMKPQNMTLQLITLKNAQSSVVTKIGQKNVFAGTDINQTVMENAFLFALKDGNYKEKHSKDASRFALNGIIIMMKKHTNVYHAQLTVYMSPHGSCVDVWVVMSKFKTSVYFNVGQVK
jgi:hypothetical protein